VAKCTNYGVFIDIADLAMGGMIHISNLSKQFVRFNPANESLSAGTTIYRVGTVLQVQVATVDFNQRRADFMLVGENVERGPAVGDQGRTSDERVGKPREGGRRSEGRGQRNDRRPSAGGGNRPPKAEGRKPDGRGPKPASQGPKPAASRGPKPQGGDRSGQPSRKHHHRGGGRG